MNIVSLNSSQNSFYISKYWKNHSEISSFSLILGTKNLAKYWDQTTSDIIRVVSSLFKEKHDEVDRSVWNTVKAGRKSSVIKPRSSAFTLPTKNRYSELGN